MPADMESESPTLSRELLARLRCPVDKGSLRELTSEEVSRLNANIESGEARDRMDSPVTEAVEGGLTGQEISTESIEMWIYPIRGGIPTLVADEAIRIVRN